MIKLRCHGLCFPDEVAQCRAPSPPEKLALPAVTGENIFPGVYYREFLVKATCTWRFWGIPLCPRVCLTKPEVHEGPLSQQQESWTESSSSPTKAQAGGIQGKPKGFFQGCFCQATGTARKGSGSLSHSPRTTVGSCSTNVTPF